MEKVCEDICDGSNQLEHSCDENVSIAMEMMSAVDRLSVRKAKSPLGPRRDRGATTSEIVAREER